MTKDTSVMAKFMDWLRGDSKSIKSRFFYRPLERLDLFWSTKIRGETYTEWYRRRMNRMAEKSSKANRPLSQKYLDNAVIQVNYLKHHDLKPDHDVLEYGCGILRVGLHLLPYLEEGRYTAADISENRIEKGVGILAEKGFDRSGYRTVVLTTAEARELGDVRYDYILAHDVFAHMPLSECHVCLKSLARHLKPKGQIFVTFDISDEAFSTNAKDYWFTRDQIRKMAEEARLVSQEMEDWADFKLPTQTTQKMFRFTHV
ncbi:MAG: class I SAM-dependent methyltransferase [Alphaproteobacteria bacterium]|nr:class I SAM-dependent methyltransferase [Alphaproteobacteria bacterium]